MKSKLLCFLLPALCAAMLCGGYVGSTSADSARNNSAGQPALLKPSPAGPVHGPALLAPDPSGPKYSRWTCDQQSREARGDKQAIRSLMVKHLHEAAKYLLVHTMGSRDKITPNKDLSLERRRAMGIALAAADWASSVLGDFELANRICDDYLLPNLTAAAPERCAAVHLGDQRTHQFWPGLYWSTNP